MEANKTRQWVGSGTHWEDLAGYARAVRVGDRIFVSGTTATGPEGLVGGDDAAAQMRFIVIKIEKALKDLGGRLEDVVRTRMFVSRISDWEAVARVHGDVFRNIRPVCTLVEAKLVGPEYLVEMEAEAIVGAGPAV